MITITLYLTLHTTYYLSIASSSYISITIILRNHRKSVRTIHRQKLLLGQRYCGHILDNFKIICFKSWWGSTKKFPYKVWFAFQVTLQRFYRWSGKGLANIKSRSWKSITIELIIISVAGFARNDNCIEVLVHISYIHNFLCK